MRFCSEKLFHVPTGRQGCPSTNKPISRAIRSLLNRSSSPRYHNRISWRAARTCQHMLAEVGKHVTQSSCMEWFSRTSYLSRFQANLAHRQFLNPAT